MREQHSTTARTLTLYAGAPHICSYLPGEVAVTQFVDPSLPMSTSLYSELVDVGFRRSGEHVYRPRCRQCDSCIPARIPVANFAQTVSNAASGSAIKICRQNWRQFTKAKSSFCCTAAIWQYDTQGAAWTWRIRPSTTLFYSAAGATRAALNSEKEIGYSRWLSLIGYGRAGQRSTRTMTPKRGSAAWVLLPCYGRLSNVGASECLRSILAIGYHNAPK